MEIEAKDGAWVSEMPVSKFNCTRCGTFYTSDFPMTEGEIEMIIHTHIKQKHGGRGLS